MTVRSLLPFGRSSTPSRVGNLDPFTDMRREMDRLFDHFSGGWDLPQLSEQSGFLAPKVNVSETEKGLELSAELPGIDEKDIELDVTDGILTLKAEHKEEKDEEDKDKRYHVVERSYGTFLRRFALPFDPDTDKVKADFEKGVLNVFIPRPEIEEKKATKITVNRG